MQELRWQDRPVTYGCLVRLFFISATILLIAVATAILILNIGGTFWSTSSSAILLGLGVLFGFLQWRFPLSPSKSKSSVEQSTSSPSEQAYASLRREEKGHISGPTGTLIVLATKEQSGKVVYLLPRDTWNKNPSSNARDSSSEKLKAIVTRRAFNDYPIYVAVFQNIKPGNYFAWTAYGKENPQKKAIGVFPSQISELELDWLD